MSKFQDLYEKVAVKPIVVSEEKKMISVKWMSFLLSLLEATGYTVERLENGVVTANRGLHETIRFQPHGICSTELFEHVVSQAVGKFSVVTEQTEEKTVEILEVIKKEREGK